MGIQNKKNLIRSADEYTRYYGDFRGVDFSSEHTQVHPQRFAYAINMYKDYRTGEGNAIETVPGFRQRFVAPDGAKINGIHIYEFINSANQREKDIFVHAGTSLYKWDNYPLTVNVDLELQLTLENTSEVDLTEVIPNYTSNVRVVSITVGDTIHYSGFTVSLLNKLDISDLNLSIYDTIVITYKEKVETVNDQMNEYGDMNNTESQSYMFNGKLYILDGKEIYVYPNKLSGFSPLSAHNDAYVPTTYKNIAVGEAATEGIEYEQRNILSKKVKNTFIADGKTKKYYLKQKAESILTVHVYGYSDEEMVTQGNEKKYPYRYVIDDVTKEYYIEFTGTVPPAPLEKGYPENYDGVVIQYLVENQSDQYDDLVRCTKFATFDGRIFLTGSPEAPNNIWYCGARMVGDDSYIDPTYWGELNRIVDGVENAPITGLIPFGDTLAVLKNHSKQDGSLYFHKRMETGKDLIPVTYPSEQGLSGIGCLGACANFRDDPVFLSRLGVEGIDKLTVNLERTVGHRSSLIDAKLCNLPNLDKGKMIEWDGYLVVLVDGKIFLADSRQAYTNDLGTTQYEWYYLEGIGVYEDQIKEYYYAGTLVSELLDKKVAKDGVEYDIVLGTKVYKNDDNYFNVTNTPVTSLPLMGDGDTPDVFYQMFTVNNGEDTYSVGACFVIRTIDDNGTKKQAAVLCEDKGSFTGGTFKPAEVITNIDDNIFFGTSNGVICSFNFDKRDNDGSISPIWYSFDNRTIYCGLATKMDNCDIPHLTKSTIKKSTVVKTKSMFNSAAKVKVRTNKKGYEQVARLNSAIFTFNDVDFSDFSFISTEQTIFAVREKEKHWVEKQHWIYSDEYLKAFSLNYIAFRYKIAGRIKD